MDATPYFKLAVYDARLCTFKDGKRAYATEAAAIADTLYDGQYRVSRVSEAGRIDLPPFTVTGKGAAPAARKGYAAGTRPTASALARGRRWG